jgi:ADP-heptose:LPS heptosyltransferase
MMMPALQAVASMTENKQIDICLTDEWSDSRREAVEELCKAWPVVNKVLSWPRDRIDEKKYDLWYLSVHGVQSDVLYVFLSNMKKRITPKPSWRSSMVHEADHYMDIAYAMGYEGPVPQVIFPLADKPILDLPRPIIGLCNGYFRTSTHYWDKKGWPHFHGLSESLNLYFGGSLVGLGRENEIPKDVQMTADYTGKLSILETAKVISQLDLLVTTDTGLMHVADILRVPLIAMFGPTLPTKNAPRGKGSRIIQAGQKCVPCQDTSAFQVCKSNECMRSITVGDVMAKAREMLFNHSKS